MRSTFHGLEVAKRGLFAQQTAISTTGHNISNANTRGYSRQVIDMTSASAIEVPGANRSVSPGQLGTGVNVTAIRRIREDFLDQQYWTESQRQGEYDERAKSLEQIEAIFNEPADRGSLSALLNEMWGSWNQLADDPNNPATKELVLGSLKNVSDALNIKGRQLDDLKTNLNNAITLKDNQVSDYISQIQKLNAQIVKVEGLGDNANDLRDQRDVIVDDLSKLISVTVKEESNGSYTVSMKNNTGTVQTIIDNLNAIQPGVDYKLSASGELGGLRESVTYVDDYTSMLNSLANNLISELNGLHPTPLYTGTDARTIGVATSDHNDIKASTDPTKPGDGSLARAIHNLKNNTVTFSYSIGNPPAAVTTNATFDKYYSTLVSGLGVEANRVYNEKDNMAFILENLDIKRMSVSGVSLDEEMSNLIKFQHAYNAAARQMTTLDEMLDKIINGMGLVGR